MVGGVLLVHGYGFIDENNLGIKSEAVCRRVLEIQNLFDDIIFLGGWHDKNQSPDLISGNLMREWVFKESLLELDRDKFHTFSSLGYKSNPPRDTIEEVMLVSDMLIINKPFSLSRAVGAEKAYALGLWYHIPRIRKLYNYFLGDSGKSPIRTISVFNWKTVCPSQWGRIIQEPAELAVTYSDPLGLGWFASVIGERKRTPPR